MKNVAVILAMVIMFVACSSNKAHEIDKNSLTANSFINDTCKKIDDYLTKLSGEKNFSGGLLIIKDGKKIFSKGYGWADKNLKIPFTPRTLASMGSITKAFTAAAIMKLVEQNKLTLEDPLKKYFPTIPVDKESVTIHQLLTHSSGFHEFLKQDGGDYEKIETEAFLKRAFSEPLAFKPGEKAVYTNVGMSILAIIIEKVSGLDYEKYLQTNLFEPIGIKKIGYRYPLTKEDTIAIGYQNGNIWGTHQSHFEKVGGGPYWNLKGNGGLEVSLDEMYLWLNSFNNNTILKKESIEKMFTAHTQEEGYNGESFFGYGCNISKSRRNTKMIDNGGSNGIYFARIVRLPGEGVVFFMITNESTINTSMVLPNITQLYFMGKIEQDALTMNPKFENELSKKVYEIVDRSPEVKLEEELAKAKLVIDDDMILLEVGQKLMQEDKPLKALNLYKYYTKMFPKIVVAWNDMGDIYLSEDNKEEAIKCYKQALKIKPENPRAKESLSKLDK
ncbi:MAG: serine hydrolase [Sphingobacteriaceae bacterium]|nr:serine hydrolase [Sphingobacteriaceae bacterium]